MTSIVMICRDRYKLLKQAVDSLRAHTWAGDYNIVFVLDPGFDFRVSNLLMRTCEEMPGRAQLITLNTSDHVLARAKNIGVEWSRQCWGETDWLYLSDSDVWFAEGWLEKLTEFAAVGEKDDFRLWGGQIHPFHRVDPVGDCAVLDGPSWLMRWETWNTGQLARDCAPGPCQSEEYPFCATLRKRGGRIGVIHPHVVVHTGLTQTDGRDAPGRDARLAMIPQGVLAE